MSQSCIHNINVGTIGPVYNSRNYSLQTFGFRWPNITAPAECTKILGGEHLKTLIVLIVWSTLTILNLRKLGGPWPPCTVSATIFKMDIFTKNI